MRPNLATCLILAAALAASGCAKKKLSELPPADTTTSAGSDTAAPAADPAADAAAGAGSATPGAPVPGSQADLVARAGSDTIYFNTDSILLDDASRATLDAQAAWLAANPGVRVTIEGHADERGTREYNLALGDRRANSARNHLAAKGVDAGRMTVVSWGKERPVAAGSDEASWAQNRRSVTVTPQ